MAGWGLVGLAGAWLAVLSGRRLGRLGLAVACALAGLAYGALLDLSVMVTYGGEQSLDRYLALSARGIPFNIAHAAGNFAIALAAGPALVRMISRYRTRLEFTLAPAGALPLALLAPRSARALVAAASGPSPAATARTPSRRSPGCAAPRTPTAASAATPGGGLQPGDDRLGDARPRGGRAQPARRPRRRQTPVAYLRTQLDRLRSAGDLERTILALEGAGLDPRAFAGRDLVAELRAQPRRATARSTARST